MIFYSRSNCAFDCVVFCDYRSVKLQQCFGPVDCQYYKIPAKCQQFSHRKSSGQRHNACPPVYPISILGSFGTAMGPTRIHVQTLPIYSGHVRQCQHIQSDPNCPRQVSTFRSGIYNGYQVGSKECYLLQQSQNLWVIQ